MKGDIQHIEDCKKEQEHKMNRDKEIKDITGGASKEAFDRAKPW